MDTTPFYAESGGQVGDIGVITAKNAKLKVVDTIKDNNSIYMHRCEITEGTIETGEAVKAEVDAETRYAIMRNHTAAHLLQAALRRVLGTHVEQAGQLVTSDKLRFDFTNFAALSQTELAEIESQVNTQIFKGIDVITKEMPVEEAKKLGAMALFGEKYGDIVRVVMVDEFSREFCGGTHINNTSKIGLFKIQSEGSVASGVRRIEAVTGSGVLKMLDAQSDVIANAMKVLKATNANDLASVCEHTVNELKEKDKEIEKLTVKLSALNIDSLIAQSQMINGIRVIKGKFTSTNSETLKTMCDRVNDKAPDTVAVLFGIDGDKANIAVACGKEARAMGAHAGKIIKQIAEFVSGRGGGKPERAMAGVGDITKIDLALDKSEETVLSFIK